jgi:steroid delta-isomerase-like uncharacterized protein
MLRPMTEADPRVETVLEHVTLENAHDFEGCTAKFASAKYTTPADEGLYEGSAAVIGFLDDTRKAFPDFHFEASRISPGPTIVVAEGMFQGTHLGTWRGLPATGRKVNFPMCVVFEFEGDDMVNEKIYMDLATPLRQLGVAFDPNGVAFKIFTVLSHPITLTKALFRSLFRRGNKNG